MTDEVKAAVVRQIGAGQQIRDEFANQLDALAEEDAVVEMMVLSIDKAIRQVLGPELVDRGELTLTEKSMLVIGLRAALRTFAEKCR